MELMPKNQLKMQNYGVVFKFIQHTHARRHHHSAWQQQPQSGCVTPSVPHPLPLTLPASSHPNPNILLLCQASSTWRSSTCGAKMFDLFYSFYLITEYLTNLMDNLLYIISGGGSEAGAVAAVAAAAVASSAATPGGLVAGLDPSTHPSFAAVAAASSSAAGGGGTGTSTY